MPDTDIVSDKRHESLTDGARVSERAREKPKPHRSLTDGPGVPGIGPRISQTAGESREAAGGPDMRPQGRFEGVHSRPRHSMVTINQGREWKSDETRSSRLGRSLNIESRAHFGYQTPPDLGACSAE